MPSQVQSSIVGKDGTQLAEESNRLVVDEAIEAIGFGKFQWQLTFSYGFGFLVYQVGLHDALTGAEN